MTTKPPLPEPLEALRDENEATLRRPLGPAFPAYDRIMAKLTAQRLAQQAKEAQKRQKVLLKHLHRLPVAEIAPKEPK